MSPDEDRITLCQILDCAASQIVGERHPAHPEPVDGPVTVYALAQAQMQNDEGDE